MKVARTAKPKCPPPSSSSGGLARTLKRNRIPLNIRVIMAHSDSSFFQTEREISLWIYRYIDSPKGTPLIFLFTNISTRFYTRIYYLSVIRHFFPLFSFFFFRTRKIFVLGYLCFVFLNLSLIQRTRLLTFFSIRSSKFLILKSLKPARTVASKGRDSGQLKGLLADRRRNRWERKRDEFS